MTNKLTIEFLRRRFANIVCPAMGWNYGEAYSSNDAGGIKANHGNVWIEQAPNKKYWRVCQMLENSTAERNLSDNFTKSELLAWMDGVLRGSENKKLLDALALAQATIERLDAKAKAPSATGTLDVIRAAISSTKGV